MSEKNKNTDSGLDNEVAVNLNIGPFLTPVAVIMASFIIFTGLLINGWMISSSGGVNSAGTNSVAGAQAQPAAAHNDTADARPTTGTIAIGDDPYLGNRETAKFAIVEFSDYGCIWCKRFHDGTYMELIEKYVETGEAILVYKDMPYQDPDSAAMATCVQREAGNTKYFEYHDLIFANYGALTNARRLELAEQIGVDRSAVENCYNDGTGASENQEDLAAATAIGIQGTPNFIVGSIDGENVTGTIITGAQQLPAFEGVIAAYN